MLKYPLLFLSLFFYLDSFSQSASPKVDALIRDGKRALQVHPDSGKNIFRKAVQFARVGKNPADMFYVNQALAVAFYTMYELDSAWYYVQLAEKQADKVNAFNRANIYSAMAEISRTADKYERAEIYFKKADSAYRVSKIGTDSVVYLNKYSILLSNYAALLYMTNKPQRAVELNLKVLKIKEDLKDSSGMAMINSNLALAMENIGDKKQALSFHLRGLELKRALNQPLKVADALLNLGIFYSGNKEFDKALKCFEEVEKITVDNNYDAMYSYIYDAMGGLFKEMGQHDKSLYYYRKGLAFLKNDPRAEAALYGNVGNELYYLKRYAEAVEFLEKAVSLASAGLFLDYEKNAYKTLAEIYIIRGDHHSAVGALQKYNTLKDSLVKIENAKVIGELQKKYETEQKETQIELQKADLARKDEAIKRSEFQKLTYASGAVLFLILTGFAVTGYINKRKANELITKQKHEVETQKELIVEKQKEILDSINYARRIQAAILPSAKNMKEILPEFFVLYKPKDIVAGDFYWLEKVNNSIMLAVCDCTGHGVPGAMVSVVCNNGLNRSAREFKLTDPGKMLDRTREIVISEFEKSEEEVKDGMDISLVSLTKTKNENENENSRPYSALTLTWAGANNPLWIVSNGGDGNFSLREYKPDKQPIGKYAENTAFTTHEVSLSKGDTVYLFTDGYADQFGGPKGKKFKYAALKNLLLSIQSLTMNEQKVQLDKVFNDWKGDLDQVDDVCIIGMRMS